MIFTSAVVTFHFEKSSLYSNDLKIYHPIFENFVRESVLSPFVSHLKHQSPEQFPQPVDLTIVQNGTYENC